MKAKIINKNPYAPQLEEGEIVSIVPGMETDAEGIWNIPAGKLFLCRKEDGTFAYTTPRNLQILPDAEDEALWKTFRMEAAKEAMASLIGLRGFNYSCEAIANRAIAYTDELIKHLKNIDA